MDGARDHVGAPADIPACMAADLIGYRWTRDVRGESGGAVFRLHGKADASDLFLKHGRGVVADDVANEMIRLRWLASHVPVPAVRRFAATPDAAWLLTAAMPGVTAWQALEADSGDRMAVVDALADFLRRLHAVPVSSCPFNSDHGHRLTLARANLEAGLVDEEDFDEDRQGWTAGQVWDAMQQLLPFTPDPVVSHGDYSLDNVLIADGRVTGCIDVGRAGVADRYSDVAVMWNSLGEFGETLRARFLKRYGLPHPDRNTLRFHLMLDEFF